MRTSAKKERKRGNRETREKSGIVTPFMRTPRNTFGAPRREKKGENFVRFEQLCVVQEAVEQGSRAERFQETTTTTTTTTTTCDVL